MLRRLRRALPERRAVEFDDAGGKRRPAAGRIHRSKPGADPGDRRAEAGAGRTARASRISIPSEISGGMQKRAGLARAMALDPEILFFDEPSAGLDPISSRLLDDLILELRDSLGRHDRGGHSRTGQHLHDRNQQRFPRRRITHPDCTGDRQRDAGPFHGSARAQISDARRRKKTERQPVMAKRVSSASIGAFVLASAALAAIVAVVLGSGVLLTHPHYFICMFQGNLNGLKIGSAVKVKGVQIGYGLENRSAVDSGRRRVAPAQLRADAAAGDR